MLTIMWPSAGVSLPDALESVLRDCGALLCSGDSAEIVHGTLGAAPAAPSTHHVSSHPGQCAYSIGHAVSNKSGLVQESATCTRNCDAVRCKACMIACTLRSLHRRPSSSLSLVGWAFDCLQSPAGRRCQSCFHVSPRCKAASGSMWPRVAARTVHSSPRNGGTACGGSSTKLITLSVGGFIQSVQADHAAACR